MSNTIETFHIAIEDVLRDAVDGIFVIDVDRRVVLFSPGCEHIMGLRRAEVMGLACLCHEITDCRDEHDRSLSEVLCPALRVLAEEIPSARQRMSVRHGDGRRVLVETTYSPVRSEDGAITGVVAIVRDITEQMASEQLPATEWDRGSSSFAHGDMPDVNTPGGTRIGRLDGMLTSIERREILTALDRAHGQRTLAARTLGISRSRLYRRMEALGIDPRRTGKRQEVPSHAKVGHG